MMSSGHSTNANISQLQSAMSKDACDTSQSSLHPENPFLYLPPAPTRFPLHASLPPAVLRNPPRRIFIVGDLHGCADELRDLLAQERFETSSDLLVAAGDLVAKGPKSVEVIALLMEYGALAVLGNHDQYLLRCAMLAGRLDGRSRECDKDIGHWTPEEVARADVTSAEYARMYYARMNGYTSIARRGSGHYPIAEQLSDEQLSWIASLPVTLDFAPLHPWLLVHAGLVAGVPLHAQHPFHCTTLRNFYRCSGGAADGALCPTDKIKLGSAWTLQAEDSRAPLDRASADSSPSAVAASPVPMAAVAPLASPTSSASTVSVLSSSHAAFSTRRIVFGHDAARGFQHPSPTRLGIDTGCCNGKRLSALVLTRSSSGDSVASIVSVPARRMYDQPKSQPDDARVAPVPSGALLDTVPLQLPAKPYGSETTAPPPQSEARSRPASPKPTPTDAAACCACSCCSVAAQESHVVRGIQRVESSRRMMYEGHAFTTQEASSSGGGDGDERCDNESVRGAGGTAVRYSFQMPVSLRMVSFFLKNLRSWLRSMESCSPSPRSASPSMFLPLFAARYSACLMM